jgi:hypothetical protein
MYTLSARPIESSTRSAVATPTPTPPSGSY